MKNASKVVTSIVVASALASISVAEESGAFLGAEKGYGDAEYKTKATIANNSSTTAYDGWGVKHGFIVGYKHFFTPFIGIRAYANINALHGSIKLEGGTTFEVTQLNYGGNVDLLGNFIAKENIDFGGFVGLGLGGNSWLGKDIDDLETTAKLMGTKLNKTGVYVALNVRLRTNIAKHHGIEIAARVPFLPTTLIKVSQQGGAFETTLASRYSITARYTFSF